METSALPNFYAVLGVPENANDRQIRKAYCEKAMEKHPDKNLGSPAATIEFQLVQQAYEVLSDRTSRLKYDVERHVSAEQRAIYAEAVAHARTLREIKLVMLEHVEHTIGGDVANLLRALEILNSDIRRFYEEGFRCAAEWHRLGEQDRLQRFLTRLRTGRRSRAIQLRIERQMDGVVQSIIDKTLEWDRAVRSLRDYYPMLVGMRDERARLERAIISDMATIMRRGLE